MEVQDETGRRLGKARLPEGVVGVARLHELVARFAGEDTEPEQVLVGIETDRGPWVAALVAAGYMVFAINPRQVARYRERHGTSGAKSDLLTELPGGFPGWRVRLPVVVARFPPRDQRWGCAAGVVRVGGAAARVA